MVRLFSQQNAKDVVTLVLVLASSEIPLPSPPFHSLSGLGPEALDISLLIFGRTVASHRFVLQVWCSGAAQPWTLSYQKPQDLHQMGSLAGAARLLQNNAGVLKQGSDGTEIPHRGSGQRSC